MPRNAAGRVHSLLTEAKSRPANQPAFHVWASVLGCGGSVELVLPLLAEILEQLDDVEVEIRDKFPDQKASVLLKLVPKIRQAIAHPSLGASWGEVSPLLTNEALFSLEVLAQDTEEYVDVEPDEIATINAAVGELFDLVEKSDLNKRLKQWIMNWLSAIRRAIDLYRIRGAKGLSDALIRLQGEAWFFEPALKEVEKKAPTVFERLTSLFDTICKASDISERCRKLCESPIVARLGSWTLGRLVDGSGPDVPPEN